MIKGKKKRRKKGEEKKPSPHCLFFPSLMSFFSRSSSAAMKPLTRTPSEHAFMIFRKYDTDASGGLSKAELLQCLVSFDAKEGGDGFRDLPCSNSACRKTMNLASVLQTRRLSLPSSS